jgi:hypothetical protein
MLPRLKAGASALPSALRFSGRRAKPMAIPGLELNRMRNIPLPCGQAPIAAMARRPAGAAQGDQPAERSDRALWRGRGSWTRCSRLLTFKYVHSRRLAVLLPGGAGFSYSLSSYHGWRVMADLDLPAPRWIITRKQYCALFLRRWRALSRPSRQFAQDREPRSRAVGRQRRGDATMAGVCAGARLCRRRECRKSDTDRAGLRPTSLSLIV